MEDLIDDIRKGNIHAFNYVYGQYNQKLYFFVLKYCGSEYMAQEVVQLTFIRLWEKRNNLSIQYGISVQIFRIARSLLIDQLRKENHQNSIKIISTEGSESYQNGEQVILANEQLKIVYKKIEDFPKVRKKVFKLSRIDCKSNKDIARELSLSVKTVENHIRLALKELKSLMLFVIITFLFRN